MGGCGDLQNISKILWEEFGMDPNVLGWAILSSEGEVIESTFENLTILKKLAIVAKELAIIGRRAIIDGYGGKIAIIKLKDGFLIAQFSDIVQMGYTIIKTMRVMDKLGLAKKEIPKVAKVVKEEGLPIEDLFKMVPTRTKKFYEFFSSEIPETFKEFKENATDVFLMINDRFTVEEISKKLSHIPREEVCRIILKAEEEGYISLKPP